jgi:hypothetical protein
MIYIQETGLTRAIGTSSGGFWLRYLNSRIGRYLCCNNGFLDPVVASDDMPAPLASCENLLEAKRGLGPCNVAPSKMTELRLNQILDVTKI